MIVKLLILIVGLVGTRLSSAAGPIREEDAYGAAGADAAHGHDGGHGGDDPDAGWRGFGKVVSGFTILAALVIAVVFVLMLLSAFGVFENEAIDPPV